MAKTFEPNNKRIAKNTIMLYLRMALTILIGLYTSRVILATLGAEDFGLYGVVGGIVAMMGFLNASMSGATSRFLTYELGQGNQERLNKTFSSAMIMHIMIALVVVIIAETVGLWFLCNKLVIQDNRMIAAHWVFQISILSSVLTITQVPYNSCIIAHEKMNVYAYVEILNVTLKLLIVYLLVIGNFDKLILYAILTLAVSVFVMMVYRIYCIRHFEESKFHFVWDTSYLKPMFTFSGWDLYGNLCVTARQQGINFMINIFFGTILNAAGSLASTVQGMVLSLGHNILMAYRPQIVKLYAVKNINDMKKLTFQAFRNTAMLMLCFSIPLCLELDYIMNLWLKDVPDHAVKFCQCLLVSGVFNIMLCVFNVGIGATGNVKKISFITGSLYLLNLPIIYLLYKIGYDSTWAYIVMIITNLVILITNYSILHSYIESFSFSSFFANFGRIVLVALLTLICPVLVHVNFDYGLIRTFFVFFSAFLSIGIFAYLIGFDEQTKNFVRRKIIEVFNKNLIK